MASPDEARVDEARDQSPVSDSPPTSTGTATSSWSTLSLSPSGREIDAELSYSTPVAGGWLGGNLFARRQPGHIEAADMDVGAAVRFTLGF